MDRTKLFPAYEKLLRNITKGDMLYPEERLSVFSIAVGKNFNNKLMIVGRSVNGWNNNGIEKGFDKRNLKGMMNEVKNNLETENLDWVIEDWGAKDKDIYDPNRSAFWRLSRRLARRLANDSEDCINYIAWSNLYKISKHNKGNPSDRLCDLQFCGCKEILFSEIELLKPAIVIFLTGLDWADGFLKYSVSAKQMIDSKNTFVKFIGKIGESIIIVGKHPQGKSEEHQLNEILTEIEKFS